VFARRCRARGEAGEAVADASVYLQNLQRAGWNTHW